MITTPIAIDVPLQTDEQGIIRIGGTRVTLDFVIADFHRGSTPLQIVEHYPVLKLADVYHVIGNYVANKADVDAYIQYQKDENQRIRREWEADHPPKVTKADLLARQKAKRDQISDE